jgi:hypothetical protein
MHGRERRTALMLNMEPGCTVAKPPDTAIAFISIKFPQCLPSQWRLSTHPCGCERGVYERKNCLLPPLSSMTSMRPGFNCSTEGTCWARIPMSPDSAAMLTCTLHLIHQSIVLETHVAATARRREGGNRTHRCSCK